ncbi:aromatic-L-amino-acid/L-tryptophan decarboxylase [Paragonimus westermani]|uniref:Aromatic-L-amino-acid decarboxylase n=1 Tax=Paragonimus westermani TaxID=34504 RepID=A0A5J4NQD4_9TREM|nr:aromatic-L-amino-acid/L-tryptophan decarboxylase [Paragonimus westermani]
MIRYRELPTERVGHKRVFNAKLLCEVIARDVSLGLIPLICIATMGTTSTCEFDDIDAIGRVCKQYNVWLHLDAAYAGTALLCPEYRYLANGVEFADSFCFNGNKLLRVHFDCSIMWFADHRVITKAFDEEVTYLRSDVQGMPEYRKWSISLARRFRALKLWFTLRAYGLEELRNYIRQHVAMANAFKHLVSLDERFEICNDVRFGLVCFRLKVRCVLPQTS